MWKVHHLQIVIFYVRYQSVVQTPDWGKDCRIGLADCDRIKKGMGWQAELLIIIRENKICKISKVFLTSRQGLHDSFLLFRFVKFQLAVTTAVQPPNNIQTRLIYCTKL